MTPSALTPSPSNFIGRTLRFVAEPYEAGEIQVESCEWALDHKGEVSNYAVKITGTVVSGHCTSRLMWAVSHRDIAGETLELPRCSIYDIVAHGLARYVYPV